MPNLTVKEVNNYNDVYPQLKALLSTMEELSKRRPHDPVNKFKLNHANAIIRKVNKILGPKYRPFSDFERFDVEGELTTSSDVVMMLSQYLSRMDKFESDHQTSTLDKEVDELLGGSKWNTKA